MPRPALVLVVSFFFALALAFSPPPALAVTSDAKVALHVQSHAAQASTICTSGAPTTVPCSQYVTSGNLNTGYDMYVTVGEADSTGVAGLTFGIDYDGASGQGTDVIQWVLCASGLEFPSSSWPDAGQGNILTWNLGNCGTLNLPPNGYHGIAGAFYVYAYSADTFAITEHMLLQGGPDLDMANCNGAQRDLITTNVGSVDFGGGPGFNPCLGTVGNPVCSVSHSVLDFGTVGVGNSLDLSFQITNDGPAGSALFGNVSEACDDFSIVSGGGSFSLNAGQSRTVQVRYSPSTMDLHTCTVDLGIDCPPVELQGQGGGPPDIGVSPTGLSADLLSGETSMQILSIKNAGESDLSWIATGLTGFISVAPQHGTLPPSSTADLQVLFDASGLFGGDYNTEILIESNDPDEPTISVPVHLAVTGIPDIDLAGFGLESVVNYTGSGATTNHSFSVPGLTPGGTATLEILVEGDYGASIEFTTVFAEGTQLGTLGFAGSDCLSDLASFQIDAVLLESLASDGVIDIQLVNTPNVDFFCPVNRHTVRLRLSNDLLTLDMGEVFLGAAETRDIEIASVGTADLEVTSIVSDNPRFTPVPASAVISPGSSRILEVTFTPGFPGPDTGILTISSNDPDEPVLTVELRGEGLEPPDITVSPLTLSESLVSGASSIQVLTLGNIGLNDLDFTVAIGGFVSPGAMEQPFQGLSPGDPSVSDNPPAESQAPGEGSDFLGVPGQFEALSPSPVPMTCLAEDASTGIVYAQANQAADFYRYRSADDTWEPLEPSPLIPFNNGGAVVLDRKVYTVHVGNGSEMGVYDIAEDSWTTVAYPLSYGTACIATDGTYLYLLDTDLFVRYNPADATTVLRAAPPFPFTPWGSLDYVDGEIYGHRGNGSNLFARYDVAGNSWTTLPSAPAGLVNGSAIDPVNRDYYCYGSYGSNNLLRYSMDQDMWSASSIPFFPVGDGGMAWFGGPAAVYFVQGDIGTGLARLFTDPIFVAVSPSTGSIPPSGSLGLDVRFQALDLIGGDYSGELFINSNDPDEPQISVPVQLNVIGTPDIHVTGQEIVLASTQIFTPTTATTIHPIPVGLPPSDGGLLELEIEGDFGDPSEIATVSVEGVQVGTTVPTGIDCISGDYTFSLSPALLASAAADGVIEVRVQNSAAVGTFCPSNRHTVRIRYAGPVDPIDFGEVLIGSTEDRVFRISNAGNETLNVTGISLDNPVFSLDTTGPLTLLPGEGRDVIISYSPSGGVDMATVTVDSDDPDEPTLVLDVVGEGVTPPVIAVNPPSLNENLFTGATSTQVLTISNNGGGTLEFDVFLEDTTPPGAVTIPFEGLSPGVPGASDNPETGEAEAPGFADFAGAEGDFENLPPSPAPLTCVVADPQTATLYAQANQGTDFYRYRTSTGVWETLAPCPISSGNNGGAVVLNGNIYTCYTGNSVQMGVYDIAGGTWSVVANPLGRGTANIATDGTYIYLAEYFLVRWDPSTGTSEALTSPDLPFFPWGGLRHLDGVLYGHTGNGTTGFQKYDIASDTWTVLPPVPSGAVLGAAIDPNSGDYFTYGGYGGTNLYRYSTTGEFWTVYSVPFFPLGDGGLVWLPFPKGIYFVQGESGTGFARFFLGADFLSVDPLSGSVDGLSSRDLTVDFNATGLPGGIYSADIIIQSNDPVQGQVTIPAELSVTGVPDIVISDAFLDFGDVLLGDSADLIFVVFNNGTDSLEVTGIISDNGDYTPDQSVFTLPPGDSRDVTVTFAPSALGTVNGILTVSSNDPDEGSVPISLTGAGVEAPDISVSPASLTENLISGETSTQILTVFNDGGSDLIWEAAAEFTGGVVASATPIMESPPRAATTNKEETTAPPPHPVPDLIFQGESPIAQGEQLAATVPGPVLEDVLDDLNAGFPQVTAVIPNRFDFLEGETGSAISDGGNDMYDGGNFLSTDLGGPLAYSNNLISTSVFLGVEGRYFTRKFPGLFVAVADMNGPDEFIISGNLGADGSGNVDGAVLQTEIGGVTYRGFVKRVFNAFDPSVNHLIIVAENALANHDFSTNTNDDFHRVFGLASSSRVYYLLYAANSGGYIDNNATLNIMNSFLGTLNLGPSWIGLSPNSGTIPAGGSTDIEVGFNTAGLNGGDYAADILVTSNDPDESPLTVPTLLSVQATPNLEVTGEAVNLESVQAFNTSGAVTFHSLSVPFPPVSGGTLELIARGDFGLGSETATLYAEGTLVGSVSGTGTDCLPASGLFSLTPEFLSALAADGVVELRVENSISVGTFCNPNQHLVRLSYSGSADPLDFGEVYLGTSGARTMTVVNTGNDVLTVNLLSVDNPDFAVDPGGFSLNPEESHLVPVIFTPSGVGVSAGLLTLASNDPDGDVLVNLIGQGVAPPVATLSPESMTSDLLSGASETQTAVLGNTGGSDLDFSVDLELVSAPGGAEGAKVAVHARSHTLKSALACVPETSGGGAPDFPCSQYTTEAAVAAGTDVYLVVANAPDTGISGLRCGIDYDGLNGQGVDVVSWNFCATGLEFPSTSWPAAGSGNTMTWGECQNQVIPPDGVHAVFGTFYLYAYDSDSFNITEHMELIGGPQATYANCTGAEVGLAPSDLGSVRFSGGAIEPGFNPCTSVGGGGMPSWLSVDPESGIVPPSSSLDLDVTTDAAGLGTGLYRAVVLVRSNDPVNPTLSLPVDMTVTGAPDISVSQTVIDFGPRLIGGTYELTVGVTNAGSDPLVVTSVVSDNPEFAASPDTFTVSPGLTRSLNVAYSPAVAGPVSGNLTIQSNDPDEPTLVLALSGEGVTPPAAVLSPTSIVSSLFTGDVETQIATLENTGGSDLEFSVNFAGGTPVFPGEPKVALHLQSHATKASTICTGAAPTIPCSEYVNQGDLNTSYDLYVVVGNADSLGVAGLTFGIDYNGVPGQGVDVIGSWTLCTTGLEFPSNSWPDAGAGNIVTWNTSDCAYTSIPPNGVHGIAGAFYIYTYGADTFSITPHEALQVGPRFEFGNCQGLTMDLPLDAAGTATFSPGAVAPGINPCLGEGGTQPPTWLSISPGSGTVAPGSSTDLEVTTTAEGLAAGSYEAEVGILTNDPLAGNIPLGVTLSVTDAARIAFDPDSIDFGEVFVGAEASAILAVRNTGTELLEVSSAVPGLGDYTVDPATFSVDPGDSTEVEVTFSPPQEGERSSDVVFASNDPESPHSVSVTGSGVVPPMIQADPLSYEGAALPGGEKIKALTVCNPGGNDLLFNVGNRPQSASAPDGFGHVWFDSDHPGGPAFDWVDVSAVGTPIFETEADDENNGPFPVGFEFPFYGDAFTGFQVCSNGWVSFTNTQSNFSNQSLPTANSTVPENLLAVLWDDLVFDPAIGSRAYYHSDGSRLVVQFNDLRRFDEMNPPYYSFEVILYPNGDILYQYLSVGNDGESATVGIQNEARDDGLQVVHNAPYLHENLAVRFTVPAPWLSFSPSEGTVTPGSCESVDVILDAASLGTGDYVGEFFLTSNAPQNPTLLGDVLFHVGSVDPDTSAVSPGTLNSASHGQWISADVELPAPYDPADVVLSTVRIQGTIPADSTFDVIDDFNLNGIPDRTFKFDRTAFINSLPEEGDVVEVVVTGEIRDTIYFTVTDSMRIVRPGLMSPSGGETLLGNAIHEVRWTVPNGWDGTTARLFYSPDQTTWEPVADGIAGTSYMWTVPGMPAEAARLKVEIHDEFGMLGFDVTDAPFTISTQVTSVGPGGPLPRTYALLQNMPNPFSGSTTIRYDLPADSEIAIDVFDVSGRKVRRLIHRSMPAGRHQTVWDGKNDSGQRVASGIYFYRMKTPRHEDTKRLFILR